jgi:tetratricopeptide (TPR) repeat protein
VELRVEDHPDPVAELRRLLVLHRAYEAAAEADELVAEGRFDDAAARYERAAALAPGNAELLFWAGLGAAQGGDLALGVERVRQAVAADPAWRELLDRLGPEHAPAAAAVRQEL